MTQLLYFASFKAKPLKPTAMSLKKQIPSSTQLQFDVDFFENNFKERHIKDINRLSGSRKFRRYFAPTEHVRKIHKEIIEKLRKVLASRLSTSSGSYFNASPFKNLLGHRFFAGNRKLFFPRYWYTVDFKDAYDSVTDAKLLKAFGADIKDKDLLDKLKTCCFTPAGHLITGANASPLLFYGYCELTIDGPLREFCRDHGLTYKRYFDDLVFSSKKPIERFKKKALLKIIRENGGFEVNHRKIKYLDLAKGPIMFNGYCLEHRKGEQRIFLPKRHLLHLKGLLWSALNGNDPPEPSVIIGHLNVFLHLIKERGCGSNSLETQIYDLWQSYRVKNLKVV